MSVKHIPHKLEINWDEYFRLKEEGLLDKQIAKYFQMSVNTLQRKKRERGLTCPRNIGLKKKLII